MKIKTVIFPDKCLLYCDWLGVLRFLHVVVEIMSVFCTYSLFCRAI